MFEAVIEAWRGRALAAEMELDRAHARNAELAKQIAMVLEERFYRPVVTGKRAQPAAPAASGAVFPAGANLGEEALWSEFG